MSRQRASIRPTHQRARYRGSPATSSVRFLVLPLQPLPSPSTLTRVKILSVRYPGVLSILDVAPGMDCLILQRPGRELPVKNRRVVCPAPAGRLRGGEGHPLATPALNYDASGTPPVDPPKLHILDLVTPFDAQNYLRHQLPLFPPNTRLFPLPNVSGCEYSCYYCNYAPYPTGYPPQCQSLGMVFNEVLITS